jgi:hypothetical protein
MCDVANDRFAVLLSRSEYDWLKLLAPKCESAGDRCGHDRGPYRGRDTFGRRMRERQRSI